MNKLKLMAVGILLSNTSLLMAGGLLTNTNQSVHFLRNPARDASTEIDAAYTNPAGLFRLTDGFHFAFSNQSVWQTRTITSTFTPFQLFGGNATKNFEGTATAPVVPSLQAAYKKGNWVFSGNIAVCGGGGKAIFNNGLPSFESGAALFTAGLAQSGLPVNQYSIDQYMRGSSFIYGLQMGATYELNKLLSVYAGFRMNIANNGYEGHLINYEVGANNILTSASPYVDAAMTTTTNPATLQQLGLLKLASTSGAFVDVKQSGFGLAPIIGFDFNYKGLNIGTKYEFKTTLNVENKRNAQDNTNLYPDGEKTANDIPALFTIGASYKILPSLTANVGFHHFFDSNAKMADNRQKEINGGTTEYLGGVEYQVCPLFLVSSGFQITRQGVNDSYQSDLSYALNSYSIGLGGAVNVSKSVRINLGYLWTNYSNWTVNSAITPAGATTGIPIKNVYARTNKVFGVGVDFSF